MQYTRMWLRLISEMHGCRNTLGHECVRIDMFVCVAYNPFIQWNKPLSMQFVDRQSAVEYSVELQFVVAMFAFVCFWFGCVLHIIFVFFFFFWNTRISTCTWMLSYDNINQCHTKKKKIWRNACWMKRIWKIWDCSISVGHLLLTDHDQMVHRRNSHKTILKPWTNTDLFHTLPTHKWSEPTAKRLHKSNIHNMKMCYCFPFSNCCRSTQCQ